VDCCANIECVAALEGATMNADNRHEAFGVFKPVGHVVVSFPSETDMSAAVDALKDAGFDDADIRRYSPEEMVRQADQDIAGASPLAGLGQELNLVKAHRELARQGQGFLVVHAPHDEQVKRVTRIARTHQATRAQKYGTLMIEDLIEVGSNQQQVAESPDRGLDAQTVSGTEGEADKKDRPLR
jgi:hypothetical protein